MVLDGRSRKAAFLLRDNEPPGRRAAGSHSPRERAFARRRGIESTDARLARTCARRVTRDVN